MTEDILKFAQVGSVATLTLNRPDHANSIDVPLARALMEASIRCDEDDSIRCVVMTGAGRMFCSGGDVGEFSKAGDGLPSLLKALTGHLHSAISRFARMPKPFITAVNGPAAGAGFSLAILGDIVIASHSAKFTLAYSKIGLPPDGGSTWLLPRLVGLRRAQELAIASRLILAQEAQALGLVTRVVDAGRLAEEAAAEALSLAESASRAIGRTRNLLLSSFSSSLEEQMEAEARAIAAAARDPEGREGVAAYIEKRIPNFTAQEG